MSSRVSQEIADDDEALPYMPGRWTWSAEEIGYVRRALGVDAKFELDGALSALDDLIRITKPPQQQQRTTADLDGALAALDMLITGQTGGRNEPVKAEADSALDALDALIGTLSTPRSTPPVPTLRSTPPVPTLRSTPPVPTLRSTPPAPVAVTTPRSTPSAPTLTPAPISLLAAPVPTRARSASTSVSSSVVEEADEQQKNGKKKKRLSLRLGKKKERPRLQPDTFQSLVATAQSQGEAAAAVDFAGKQLTDDQLSSFCQQAPGELNWEKLDLSNNDFGDEGLMALADLYERTGGKIQSLDISDNEWTFAGIEYFRDKLRPLVHSGLTRFKSRVKRLFTRKEVKLDEVRLNKSLDVLRSIVASNHSIKHVGETHRLTLVHRELHDIPAGFFPARVDPLAVHVLDLSHNNLTALPAALAQLVNLRELVVAHNKIAELSPVLLACPHLSSFSAFENLLTALPKWLALLPLELLDVSNNRLRSVPFLLGAVATLQRLDVAGNPLEGKSARLKAANAVGHIRSHLRDSTNPDPHPVSRLVVVGTPQSGKTALINALRSRCATAEAPISASSSSSLLSLASMTSTSFASTPTVSEQPTAALAECSWKMGRRRLRALEISGRGSYDYGAHPGLLTNRAVYLVVFSALEHDGEDRVQFWLSTLSRLQGTTTLLVITHLDQIGDRDSLRTRIQNLQADIVKNRYKVASIFTLSTRDDGGDSPVQQLLDFVGGRCQDSPLLSTPLRQQRNGARYLAQLVELQGCQRAHFAWADLVRLAEQCQLTGDDIRTAAQLLVRAGYLIEVARPGRADDYLFIALSYLCPLLSQLEACAAATSAQASPFYEGALVRASQVNLIWQPALVRPDDTAALWTVLQCMDIGVLPPADSTFATRAARQHLRHQNNNNNDDDDDDDDQSTTTSRDEASIVVPSLLPYRGPSVAELTDWWIGGKETELGRIYHFQPHPVGIFSKIFVRVLINNLFRPVRAWRSGVLLVSATPETPPLSSSGGAVFSRSLGTSSVLDLMSSRSAMSDASLQIMIASAAYNPLSKDSTLSLRIRGSSADSCYQALMFLSQAIDVLLANSFASISVQRMIPCSQCRVLTDESEASRDVRLQQLFQQQQQQQTTSGTGTVRLSKQAAAASSSMWHSDSFYGVGGKSLAQLSGGGSEGVSAWLVAVLDRLLSNDPTLLRLALAGSKLSTAEMQALSRALAMNTMLWKLNVSDGAFDKADRQLPLLVDELLSKDNVRSLQSLDAHGNKLTKLPANFGHAFLGLTELHLERNGLSKLPESIGLLVNLSTLDVSDNRLTELAEEVFLPLHASLSSLSFQHNKIASIPTFLSSFLLLSRVQAYPNPVRDVPKKVLLCGDCELLDHLRSTAAAAAGDSLSLAGARRDARRPGSRLFQRDRSGTRADSAVPEPATTPRHTADFAEFASSDISPQTLSLLGLGVSLVATGASPSSSSEDQSSSSDYATPRATPRSGGGDESEMRARMKGRLLHEFALETLVSSITGGQSTMQCPICDTALRIDDMCPDIAFNHFPGQKFSFDELRECREIGSGSAAVVLRAVYTPRQGGRALTVAVKKLKTEVASQLEVFAEFRREAWLMTSLFHPSLVRLHGLCLEPLAMMLEFMDQGDLQSYLLDAGNAIDWRLTLKLAMDVASGMYYLHSRKNPIIHRDLKSPNVLLRQSDAARRVVAKIADFGLSRALAFTENVMQTSEEGCENCLWHAPEVIADKRYDTGTDVYAFAIIMWELAARARPFAEIEWMTDIEDHVKAGGRLHIKPEWPADYVALMQACWAQQPASRPPFKSIVKSLGEQLNIL